MFSSDFLFESGVTAGAGDACNGVDVVLILVLTFLDLLQDEDEDDGEGDRVLRFSFR